MGIISIKNPINIKMDLDFSIYFSNIVKIFSNNPQIFAQTKAGLTPMIVTHQGVSSFDTNYDSAVILLEANLGKNIHVIFMMMNRSPDPPFQPVLKDIPQNVRTEILNFSAFVVPLLAASLEARKSKERHVTIACQAFKATVIKKSIKKSFILIDWITKWVAYLQREETFNPQSIKAYKQREIILVDFGFNIGGEFGGRHYAVVLEKNNNPRAGVILVAPISSYDPSRGQSAHRVNVDLGIGAIHGYSKGCQVVMNQVRYISKLRIEKPKTSYEQALYLDKEKFLQVIQKLNMRLVP